MQENNNKDKVLSLLITLLFHASVLALLSFSLLTAEKIEEEGLLVNYGDSMTGSGDVEPAPSPALPEPQPVAPPTPEPAVTPTPDVPDKADGQTMDTQDFEEAAALQEAKRKAEAEAKAKREQEERIRQEQERIAKAKAEAEAAAKAKAEAEAKAKAEAEAKARAEAEARAKAEAEAKARKAAAARSAVGRGFGGAGTGSSTSQGTGGGSGNQGSLTGGNTNGSSIGSGDTWSLDGRSLVGALPKPTYNIQEEGRVIVEITVDKTGKVTTAKVRSLGTTIQNQTLWNVAIKAALKAKFNADASKPAVQSGTITYNFKLQ